MRSCSIVRQILERRDARRARRLHPHLAVLDDVTRSRTLLVMLADGDKSSQTKDIALALRLARELESDPCP